MPALVFTGHRVSIPVLVNLRLGGRALARYRTLKLVSQFLFW